MTSDYRKQNSVTGTTAEALRRGRKAAKPRGVGPAQAACSKRWRKKGQLGLRSSQRDDPTTGGDENFTFSLPISSFIPVVKVAESWEPGSEPRAGGAAAADSPRHDRVCSQNRVQAL